MSEQDQRASFQYDIKTLLILTAFVAIAVQFCILIWAVLPVRLPYVVYGLHLVWTGSWLAVALASLWFLVQSMRQSNAPSPAVSVEAIIAHHGTRKELRRQCMLAAGWGIMNLLLWLGFTLGTADSDTQWFLIVVYLQILPAAWVSHGLQFRRYLGSTDMLLRVMYFCNVVGFVLPLLTLPYNIARSM